MGKINPSVQEARNPEEDVAPISPQRAPLIIYEGRRNSDRSVVVVFGELNHLGILVDAQQVPPRVDLRDHSGGDFEWGYGGSGPSQLALALCAHALGDDRRALEVYQHFKWQHVLKFPQPGWRLTNEQIRHDVDQLEGAAS